MVRDPGRPARRWTYVLMAVAYANCEVASYLDGIPSMFGIAFGTALLIGSVAVGFFLPAPEPGRRNPPAKWTLVLVLPLIVEHFARAAFDADLPLELQLVNGLRILGLELAALSAWHGCRKLAGIVALFLAVFAAAMGDQAAMPYLLAALAVVGGIWLLLDHRTDHAGSRLAGATVERVAMRYPIREAFVFAILAAAAGGIAWAAPERVSVRLGEWLPTSGGSGDTDLRARSGLGDGPEESAGDNARAAGMVETDHMIEDSNDSLMDAASDMYGPPHKPNENQGRTIAVDFSKVRPNEGETPINRRPSRPFPTSRRGPERDTELTCRDARALFEIRGRTPLHIRFAAFDRYDATRADWLPAPAANRAKLMAEVDDWIRVQPKMDAAPGWGAVESHRFKIAHFPQNALPAPSDAERLRIRRATPDHIECGAEGVFLFGGRRALPSGVVIQTECRAASPEQLPPDAFPSVRSAHAAEWPLALRQELEVFARAAAGSLPRGWPQIEAIRDRVRSGCMLDRFAAPPADHGAPVLWFLRESRRGPDHLFASSTALLLQSLGYHARFVLGYHAAPAAFDAESGHTPVRESDLHAWCEVQLADGRWLVIESTPGYETLRPAPTLADRALSAVSRIAVWVACHPLTCISTVAAIAVLLASRRWLQDRYATWRWRVNPGRTWQSRTLRAWAVLEHRARLAGIVRSPHRTWRAWSEEVFPGSAGPVRDLVRLADWAAYGPNDAPLAEPAIHAVCMETLAEWPLARFRRLKGDRT